MFGINKKPKNFVDEKINNFIYTHNKSNQYLRKLIQPIIEFRGDPFEKDLGDYIVLYRPDDYGSLIISDEDIFHQQKYLWRFKHFNLLSMKEQTSLLKIVVSFMRFENWKNILKYNTEIFIKEGVEQYGINRNIEERNEVVKSILHFSSNKKNTKNKNNKNNSKSSNNPLNNLLNKKNNADSDFNDKETHSISDSVHQFFLLNSVLTVKNLPSYGEVKKSLNNPFDYHKVDVADRERLNYFVSLMPAMFIEGEGKSQINEYFLGIGVNHIEIINAVFNKIVHKVDKVDLESFNNVFETRDNTVYRDFYDVLRAAKYILDVEPRKKQLSGAKVNLLDSGVFDLPASFYTLCLNHLKSKTRYDDLDYSKIFDYLADRNQFKKIYEIFESYNNEKNSELTVDQNMNFYSDIKNEYSHILQHIDFEFLSRLAKHDRNKIITVIDFLSDKMFLDELEDHQISAVSYHLSYNEDFCDKRFLKYDLSGTFNKIYLREDQNMKREDVQLSFTLGFILTVADWVVNNDNNIPLSLWFNLNNDFLINESQENNEVTV